MRGSLTDGTEKMSSFFKSLKSGDYYYKKSKNFDIKTVTTRTFYKIVPLKCSNANWF